MSSYVINTYSYILEHSAIHCLNHLADQGYNRFELMMYPGHAWPSELDAQKRRELTRLIEDRGLNIVSFNMPNIDLNIAGASAEMRTYSRNVLRGIIELASDIGVPFVVIGPGKHNPLFPAPKERLLGWFYEALDELVPIAERGNVQLLVENMPFAFLPDADSLMDAVEQYGSDRVHIIYDLANAVFIREDLEAGLKRVRSRLKLVHLTETPLDQYLHNTLGRGVVPFEKASRIVSELNFPGPFVLEVVDPNPDEALRHSIEYLEEKGWGQLVRS